MSDITLKIKVSVSTGYVGSQREDTIEVYVPETASKEEVERLKNEAATEWMYNNIDWGWSDVD